MPMVKETRHIFEVKDIIVVRVRCKSCSNEVAMRLRSDETLPDNCPMCNDQKWLAGSRGRYPQKVCKQSGGVPSV